MIRSFLYSPLVRLTATIAMMVITTVTLSARADAAMDNPEKEPLVAVEGLYVLASDNIPFAAVRVTHANGRVTVDLWRRGGVWRLVNVDDADLVARNDEGFIDLKVPTLTANVGVVFDWMMGAIHAQSFSLSVFDEAPMVLMWMEEKLGLGDPLVRAGDVRAAGPTFFTNFVAGAYETPRSLTQCEVLLMGE